MTFLPIVERELRVASRRRGTFMMRLQIAGAATMAFGVFVCLSAIDPTVAIGRNLFLTLSAICMVYCLVAGRLTTADSLSREKREGTLGLLFLTDLTGDDVVLGKMAATALNGFYGLLAVFPLMAVPMLAGGMTSGEFWRMVVVLLVTFLFSTAVGIYASALCKDHERAMGMNFGLMLLFGAVPPVLWTFFSAFGNANFEFLLYLCPVYAYLRSFDLQLIHGPGPVNFWRSILVILCWALVLIRKASRIAPQSWQDKPMTPQAARRKADQHRRRWWREGRRATAIAFRKQMLDINAYLWLTARPYLKIYYVWLAMFGIACSWLFTNHLIGSIDAAANLFYTFLANGMLKLWIISEAGHQLAEDKRSGAYELLLSTPLRVDDILRGQWAALRRQFFKPVVVTLAAEFFLMFTVSSPHREEVVQYFWLMFAGMVMLVADMMTIGWVAMAASLKEKNHSMATAKATAQILSLPWMVYGAIAYGARTFVLFFFRDKWDPPLGFDIGCWLTVGIIIDAIFWTRSRRRMQIAFRELALSATEGDAVTAAPAQPVEKPPVRRRFRRFAVRTAIAVFVFGIVAYSVSRALRVVPPPPIVVSLSQSNGPVRIFWGPGDVSFIMPDGALWRWEHSNFGAAATPTEPRQLGTNRDWAYVSMGVKDGLGIRTNGTLWRWTNFQSEPIQLGTNRDWSEVIIGNDFGIGRKRDGTMWSWGKNNLGQLGIGVDTPVVGSIVTNRGAFFWKGGKPPRPTYQTNFITLPHGFTQIGDRHDWKSIGGGSYGLLAMRADGTLWTWGRSIYFSANVWSEVTNFAPIRACQESNWVAFAAGGTAMLHNSEGQWWNAWPALRSPAPDAPFASIGRMISAAPMAAVGSIMTTNWQPALFEMQLDGSIWKKIISWPLPSPGSTIGQRFGEDSNWTAIWGNFNSVFGQKSDGSLWIWCMDYRQLRRPNFRDRWNIGVQKIRGILGGQNRSGMEDVFEGYQIQEQPVPLFKFVGPDR